MLRGISFKYNQTIFRFGIFLILATAASPVLCQHREVTSIEVGLFSDSAHTRSAFNSAQTKLDSILGVFNMNLDSLKFLSSERYLVEIQKHYKRLEKNLADFKSRKDTLSIRIEKKLQEIDSLVAKKKSVLDSLLGAKSFNGLGGKFKFGSSHFEIPAVGNQLPIKSIPVPEGENLLKNLNLKEVPALNLKTTIPDNVKDDGNELRVMDQPSSNILNEKKLKEKVEEAAGRFEEIKSVEKSQQKLGTLKNEADEYANSVKDPDAMKKKAKENFVDHFAGKEELIRKDLEDIGKLQLKYRDVADSRLLPKHGWKRNSMKEKPFIERLVPGMCSQIFFIGNNISVNAAPTLGYKVSGIFQGGISAYKRITYFKKDDVLKFVDGYGYRFFGQVKVIRQLHAYSEFERYKAEPDVSTGLYHNNKLHNENVGLRNKINFGVLQTYSISKNISGYFVVLYDVLQLKQFPNTAGSSARFGFQYEVKKRRIKK